MAKYPYNVIMTEQDKENYKKQIERNSEPKKKRAIKKFFSETKDIVKKYFK